eukprot:733008_1
MAALPTIDFLMHFMSKIKCDKHTHSQHTQKPIQCIDILSNNLVLDSLKNALTCHYRDTRSAHSLHCIDIVRCLDDYIYILLNVKDTKEFEYIYRYLGGKCNIHNCQIFTRNYRERRCDNVVSHNIATEHQSNQYLVKRNIMDKIHCYFFHSFDIGHMLTSLESNELLLESISKNKSSLKNAQIAKHTAILNRRKSNLSNTSLLRRRGAINHKFNQLCIPSEDDIPPTYYHFGIRFKYEGHDHEDMMQSTIPLVRVKKKYTSFKEELISNKIAIITLLQFDLLYESAVMHFATNHRKQYYPDSWIESLFAIMIYCNFTHLQYEFSKTYRELNGVNHTEFYHLGKNMRQAVHVSGTDIVQGHVRLFYHGINKQMFLSRYNDFGGARIFSPLSTTSSFAVAMDFTQNNGIIVTFSHNTYHNHRCKYFSCKWLSDFASENEYLFVQSKGKLAIRNIVNVQTSMEYKTIISALWFIHYVFHYDEHQILEFDHEQAILIRSILQLEQESMFTCNKYAKHIIDSYFPKQTWLEINFEKLKQWQHDLFSELLMEDKWIKLEKIMSLFSNVKRITICNVVLSECMFENILTFFNTSRTDSMNSKKAILCSITLKNFHENKTESAIHLKRSFHDRFHECSYVIEDVRDKPECDKQLLHITYQTDQGYRNERTRARRRRKPKKQVWLMCNKTKQRVFMHHQHMIPKFGIENQKIIRTIVE